MPLTTNYPGALDSLANPDETTFADDTGFYLDEVIARAHDILEALETKLGSGASVPTTVGNVLAVTGAGATAYGPYALAKLGEVNGTGASGVLEFSSIPATYRHLMLVMTGRSDAAGISIGWRVTFETTPTAGAYSQELLQAFGTTVQAIEQLSGVSDFLSAGTGPGASSPANLYASAVIHLPNYAATDQYKTLVANAFGAQDTTTGNLMFRFAGGLWTSTAAINRVRITLASGNWTTASRATLYGLPA